MRRFLLLLTGLLLSISSLHAQNPGELDLTFNADGVNYGDGANNTVRTTALQPDGKILLGGAFSSYNGTSRNYIARLNADGSLDTSFSPGTGANYQVQTIALQPDGKILIGGDFTSYNGTSINRIARLNADGSLDTSFNPGTGANNLVKTTALQPDGKILLGGWFDSYNGISRSRIARLNADGSLDTSFNPGTGANSSVSTIAIQPDGKILLGGAFSSYNGTSRNYIARLNADGSLDTSFDSGMGANSTVWTTALQPDGKILIGGYFSSYNSTSRINIARLNADGSLDTSFNPGTGANGIVWTSALQPDGKILIGGYFTSYNGISRSRIARLNADGSLDTSFNPSPGANNIVLTIALQPDGKILIGGEFTSYNGTSINRIARINADGSLDTSFNPGTGANGQVRTIALQPDGKILIGGEFTSYNGTPRNNIARLNTDGSLDTSFNPGTGANGTILTTELQSDGKILIGGAFTSYNGTTRNGIARLNSDGSLDTSFNPGMGANSIVWTTALQPDGKILIGGSFTSYNGISRNYIARLNADGSLDTSFNPGTGANNIVWTIVLQADGKIFIGGDFTSYNGTFINRIARLNADGSLDTSFNPGTGVNGSVLTIALQPDGKILIGGYFTSYNGTSRNNIARSNADGSLDTSFNPGTGANGSVWTIALQPDGKILLGGNFTFYNGTSISRIARLNADGSLDISFNPGTGANSTVYTAALQPDGKILLGGIFTGYNGVSRVRIARIFGGGEAVDEEAPVPDVENLEPINAQCLVNFEDLTIPTATDNVDGTIQGTTDQSIFPITTQGTTTITWTYSDEAGNTSSQTQDIVILDTELPVIQAGSNVQLEAEGNACQASVSIPLATATDNCSVGVPIGLRSDNLDLTDSYPVGETTITWNVTDINGNAAIEVIQTITVTDTQAPVISTNGDQSVDAEAGDCSASVTVSASATDNCTVGNPTGVRSYGQDLTDPYPVGVTTITWNVTDINGNPAAEVIQTITVTDNQAPVISTNGDQNLLAESGLCAASFIAIATATDNCIVGNPTGVRSDNLPLTDPYPVGETTITWNVTDINGNPAIEVIQTITVTDTQVPVISTNGDQTLLAESGLCTATFAATATATDNCTVGNPTGIRSDNLPLTDPYPVGETTITWNVTDVNGNPAIEVIQTITVTDTQAPVISTNGDQNLFAEAGLCTASFAATAIATDNCSVGNPTGIRSDNLPLTDPYPVGETTITWNVTDVNGNPAIEVIQTITVTDNQAPEISTNGDQNLFAESGLCTASFAASANATDNCTVGNPTGIRSDNMPLTDPYPVGETTINWNVTDVNGNPAIEVIQTITVTDNQVPEISTNGDQTLFAESELCSASVTVSASATDNCSVGEPTGVRSDNLSLIDPYPVGETTITWNVTDINGNPATQVIQTITVTDIQAPEISVNGNQTLNAESGLCTANFAATASATDNCSVGNPTGVRSDDLPLTDAYPVGETTITWNVTDVNGNPAASVVQTIKVADTQAPVINTNGDQNVNAELGLCAASFVATATATDNCTVGNPTGIRSDNLPLTDPYPVGETTITWSVTDINGNPAIEVIQTIAVTDSQAPVISTNGDQNLQAESGFCSATVTVSASATDNCSVGNPTGIRSDNLPLTDPYPVGETTITWNVTDVNGNPAAEVIQTIAVTDSQAPVISTNGDQSVDAESGLCTASFVATANATDNCTVGNPTGMRSDNLPLTDPYPVGETTITWSVTDFNGNPAVEVNQTITVTDNQAPVISTNGDQSVDAESGLCTASFAASANATDNCSVGDPTGVRSDNLPLTDPYPVGETTITWNVTDINGNPAIEVIQTIKVTDTQVPVISTNGDQTLLAEAGLCTASFAATANATDNCSVGNPTGIRSDNLPLTDPYPVGETTITWTVTDVNGKAADEVIQTIVVTDDQKPEVLVKNYTLQLDNTGNGVLVVGDIDNGSFDNCTIVSRVLSKTTYTCANEGDNVVTLTVTDAAGNSASANATVTVLAPIIPISVNINSTVAPNGNNNVVIFDGAAASLNLPSSTILSAAGIPSSYTGLTYKWYLRNKPSGSFQSSPISTSPSIVVNASGDFVREYKLMVFSNSGCIAEKTISVISVEASCGKAGQNKVTVCQLSPNGKRKTICVSYDAVNDLLAGSPGSFVGSCNITFRLDEEPELITVPWNTPLEVIKEKIAAQSENWFDRQKINLSISADSYNPLTSGLYEVKVDLEENEWFMLEEPISIEVLVLDKPQALDISISNDKLAKDVRSGQVIGNLGTIDPADDIHTYSMDEHPDLNIQGNQLIWKGTNIPAAQMKVTVFSTDRAGQTISKEIKLSRELKPGEFFLYPNPAVNETNVMVELDQSATVAFEVYDAIGRLVIQDEAYKEGSFTHIIKLDGLAPGMYTVQLKIANMVMTKRLIKN